MERRTAEDEVSRLNRILKVLTFCNEALIHTTKESILLNNVCHIVVDTGGYHMAWIGLAKHDPKMSVHPVAHLGFKDEYLEGLKILLGLI
ncbi:MAG: hypothetical protein ABIF11_00945 [Nitrospirota bacterium]